MRPSRLLLPCAALWGLALSCSTGRVSPPPLPPCQPGGPDFIGNPSQSVQLSMMTLDTSYSMRAVLAGGPVDLIVPPQGGEEIFAGAEVGNLAPCHVTVTGDLRDPGSGTVIGLDGRTINLVLDTRTGLGRPADPADISQWANIPSCPSAAATRNVHDQTWKLEVMITDSAGRSGSASLEVIPRCAEAANAVACACFCSTAYLMGNCSP